MRGYRWPAEWEPHAATWLSWPHKEASWPGKFELVPPIFAEMVRALVPGERVEILAGGAVRAADVRAVLSAAGYRVGTFTSPHLRDYRERIRIHDAEVSADDLVRAFERIESARGELGLTFFEFNTLAALLVFESARLDGTTRIVELLKERSERSELANLASMLL